MRKKRAASLYESDETAWKEKQASLIESGKIDEVDYDSLLQYLIEMTRSDKRSVESLTTVLLTHLLKLKLQPSRKTKSWIKSVMTSRNQLNDYISGSPSLKKHMEKSMATSYRRAVGIASIETGILASRFPSESPFTTSELLDDSFFVGQFDQKNPFWM